MLANSLELGCDCLGEIHYFDGVVNDQDGEPVTHPQRDLHARGGLRHRLEAHRLPHRARPRCAGSRRLVVSCFATVGNYEYGFFWYLYTDGTIEFEVKLTGILSTGAVAAGEEPTLRHARRARASTARTTSTSSTSAWTCEVDGERNSVYEVDAAPLPPGPDNPYGNAW